MIRKLIAACMAMAAFGAFVLPPSASATNDPQLTVAGVTVSIGSGVGVTITGLSWRTTSGNELVNCSKGELSGSVKANSGGNVAIEMTSAAYSGTGSVHSDNSLKECTGSFGNAYITPNLPMCLESTTTMADDEFQISGGACGTHNKVKFIIGSTTAGSCEYESTGAISGTVTTNGAQAELTVNNTQAGSGMTKINGGFLCPSSIQLKVTITLHTPIGSISFTIS